MWLLHNQLYSNLLLIHPSPISVPQKTPTPETKPFFTGRVLSLILARYMYKYYAYYMLYSQLGDWYTRPDEEELYSSVTDISLSPSINTELEED